MCSCRARWARCGCRGTRRWGSIARWRRGWQPCEVRPNRPSRARTPPARSPWPWLVRSRSAPGRSSPLAAERLGVLLVSFASLGGQAHQRTMYVPHLAAHPHLRLVAVADEVGAPAEQHALNQREADAPGLPYIASLDVALDDPRVQMVSVCCPLGRRLPVLEPAAAARKPALVGKP